MQAPRLCNCCRTQASRTRCRRTRSGEIAPPNVNGLFRAVEGEAIPFFKGYNHSRPAPVEVHSRDTVAVVLNEEKHAGGHICGDSHRPALLAVVHLLRVLAYLFAARVAGAASAHVRDRHALIYARGGGFVPVRVVARLVVGVALFILLDGVPALLRPLLTSLLAVAGDLRRRQCASTAVLEALKEQWYIRPISPPFRNRRGMLGCCSH